MGGDGEEPGEGGGGGERWKRLPETLEATLSLLSRLQAVMTRAWDPAEFSPASNAAATTSAATAETNSGAAAAVAAATAAATGRASGSIASAWGVSGTPPVSEEEEEADDDED